MFHRDKVIDVFIELASHFKQQPTDYSIIYKGVPPHALIKLQEEFNSCLSLTNQKNGKFYRSDSCPYPNVRFHMTDIRIQIGLEFNLQGNIIESTLPILLAYRTNEYKRHRIINRIELLFTRQLHKIDY